jgi:hypothetical protein
MERRRLGFEKINLQDSTDLADEAFEEMIHDRDGAGGDGWILWQLFREGWG